MKKSDSFFLMILTWIRDLSFPFLIIIRVNGDKSVGSVDESSFQIAASWQANKNFLVKVRVCLLLYCSGDLTYSSLNH